MSVSNLVFLDNILLSFSVCSTCVLFFFSSQIIKHGCFSGVFLCVAYVKKIFIGDIWFLLPALSLLVAVSVGVLSTTLTDSSITGQTA